MGDCRKSHIYDIHFPEEPIHIVTKRLICCMFVYILRVSAVKLVKATYYMTEKIKFISSLAVGDLKHLNMLAKNVSLE